MANKKKLIEKNKEKIYKSNAKEKFGMTEWTNTTLTQRIQSDLNKSYHILSEDPVYLHTSIATFEYAFKRNQRELQSKTMYNKIINAWKKEAEVLKRYCHTQEDKVLKAVNQQLKNNKESKHYVSFEEFINNLQNILQTKVKDPSKGIGLLTGTIDSAVSFIQTKLSTDKESGRKKNWAQLLALASTYDALVKLLIEHNVPETDSKVINLITKSDEVRAIIQNTIDKSENTILKDGKFDANTFTIPIYSKITNLTKEMQNYITELQKSSKLESTKVQYQKSGKNKTADIEGKSVQGLNSSIRGLLGEVFLAENIIDAFQEMNLDIKSIIKLVGDDTHKGTSRDMLIDFGDGAVLSISIKSKTIQQTAASLSNNLQQFFVQQKDDSLLQLEDATTLSLFDVYKTNFNFIDVNVLQIAKYLIYSSFYVTQGNKMFNMDLFMDFFKVLAMAHLNEKLFGYGKVAQTDNLHAVLQQIPTVTIAFDGTIITMSKVLENLLRDVELLYANILTKKNYITVDFNGLNPNIKGLKKVKFDYIKTFTRKKSNLQYKGIKEAIMQKLIEENNKIEQNVTISIFYNLSGAW